MVWRSRDIGNLPYTSTTAAITSHFARVKPQSIRHATARGTGRSKGFAFLEFGDYDRLKTCLKVYHHSEFDDGLSPSRKINVELTYLLPAPPSLFSFLPPGLICVCF